MTGSKISQEQFLTGIQLLAEAYPKGRQHAVFTNQTIQQIWFRFFSHYSTPQFKRVIEHYLTNASWFPNAPHEIQKLWDESGEQERAAHQELASLPAAKTEDFTPEQLIENRKKLSLAIKLMMSGKGVRVPSLTNITSAELEAIVIQSRTFKPAKEAKFYDNITDYTPLEDMRKYLHSDIEHYQNLAISWAKKNNCEIVRDKKGNPIDIKEYEAKS